MMQSSALAELFIDARSAAGKPKTSCQMAGREAASRSCRESWKGLEERSPADTSHLTSHHIMAAGAEAVGCHQGWQNHQVSVSACCTACCTAFLALLLQAISGQEHTREAQTHILAETPKPSDPLFSYHAPAAHGSQQHLQRWTDLSRQPNQVLQNILRKANFEAEIAKAGCAQ